MTTLISAIVGSHFHPPAKLLLSKLPATTPILIEPDTDNPYDAAAIRVLIYPLDIPLDLFSDEELINTGSSKQLLADEVEPIHLGFLPASPKTGRGTSLNTEVLPIIQSSPNWNCALTFLPDGSPAIKLFFSKE